MLFAPPRTPGSWTAYAPWADSAIAPITTILIIALRFAMTVSLLAAVGAIVEPLNPELVHLPADVAREPWDCDPP
jgi:heme/copper-type cytochrome/quinol oxidase subunit 1